MRIEMTSNEAIDLSIFAPFNASFIILEKEAFGFLLQRSFLVGKVVVGEEVEALGELAAKFF